MRSKRLFVIAQAGIWFSVAACGKDVEWPDCKNPDYESQTKQNACAAVRYKSADKELNRQYKTTLKRLSSSQRKLLVLEQQEWLRKLVPKCEEPLGPRKDAGDMWSMEYNDCLAQETEARAQALKRWQAK